MSWSKDYLDGCVVIRDFKSVPVGRVFAIIPRESKYEAEQIAQRICDFLNKEEKDALGTV